MTTAKFTDAKRHLHQKQGGLCASCGLALDQAFRITRSADNNAFSSLAAVHTTCPPNTLTGEATSGCAYCGASPGHPCLTRAGKPTRPHKGRSPEQ